MSVAGLALGAACSALITGWALLFYAGLCMLSLLYQAPFRSREKPVRIRVRSLKDIPGSKDLFSALAWSVIIALIPISGLGEAHIHLQVWLIFALVFLTVLARSIIQDFRDLQADRMVGKETIPILLGEKKPRIDPLNFGPGLRASGGRFLESRGVVAGPGLALGIVWLWLCVPLFTQKTLIQGLRAEMLVDFSFILAGATGLALARF